MDPTNNLTPTPNPAPEPGVGVAPGGASVNPAPAEPMGASVAASASADVVPAAPNPGVNPAPVNPVVTPGANPIASNPAFQQTGDQGLAATDPIMQPEPAKAPDPVEEELKAPMKAAAPAPGSIGSAVSGPEGGMEPAGVTTGAAMENSFAALQSQTPNVAFNDPAAQADVNNSLNQQAKPAKKKTSKTTWIALIVVALMIVVALAAVLIMSMGK